MHISKPLALVLARAIVDGAEQEMLTRQCLPNERLVIRSSALRALDNLWYDVFPVKTRDLFHPRHGSVNGARDAWMDLVWNRHLIQKFPGC